MKIEARNFAWYVKGLNEYLSNKGYVQWATKEKMIEDYKDGLAYFIDEGDMTFGLCGIITQDYIKEAAINTCCFKSILNQ